MILNELKTIGFVTSWIGLAYFWITYEVIFILAILMWLDFITWITKSLILWKKIMSRKAISGALSKIFIFFVPFVVVLCWNLVDVDSKPLAGAIMWIIGLSEAYSVICNIIVIRTGEDIVEQDAITILLTKIKDIIKNWIEVKAVK